VRRLGLRVAESDANFIWLHLPDEVEEADVVAGLRERGVLVRAGASLGREGALRVTVGADHENERFVAALGELIS
jgi:histidinol-phosphate aminotransferase